MPDARILVTGSRSWGDAEVLAEVLLDVWHDATHFGYDSIVIVHGGADGADSLAGLWAMGQGLDVEVHEADWGGSCGPDCPPGHRKTNARGSEYCPLAGPRRNQRMVDAGADLVVAFQLARSRGTADAIDRARKADLPVRHITA
jgi:hypothetical protein